MAGSLMAGPISFSPAPYSFSNLVIQRGASCTTIDLRVKHSAFSSFASARLICNSMLNHPTALSWYHPCSGHAVVADSSSEECVALLSRHLDQRLGGMARSSAWIVLGITLSGDETYFISPSNDHTAADALDFCQWHSIINTTSCVDSIVSQAQSQQATKVARARVVHSAPDAWDTEPYPMASYLRHSMASEHLTWISPLAAALLCRAVSMLSPSSSHRTTRSKHGVLSSVDLFLTAIVLAVCAYVGYAIVLDRGVFSAIQRLSSASMMPAIVILWTSVILLMNYFFSSSPSESTRSPTHQPPHTHTHTCTHTACPPAAASPGLSPAGTPTDTHATPHSHTHRTPHTDISPFDFIAPLRGLASLSVFLGHYVGLYFPRATDMPQRSYARDTPTAHDLTHAYAILRHPITQLLYAGVSMVHLFMAINGHVQLYSYFRDRKRGGLHYHSRDTHPHTPRGRPRHPTHALVRSLIARPFRLCGPLLVAVLITWCAAKMGALSFRERARGLTGSGRFGHMWVAPHLERATLADCVAFVVHVFAARWTRDGHVPPQEGVAWTMRPLFQGSMCILMAAPLLFSLRGEARAAVYAVALSVIPTHHDYGQLRRSMLGGVVIMDAFNSTPALHTFSHTTPCSTCVRVCTWLLRAFLACVWATSQQNYSPAELRSDGAVCMLLLLRLTPQLCRAMSRCSVLQWLGKLSFSMYLWHDFLLHSLAACVFVACVSNGRVGYTLAAVAGCVCALFVTLCVCCVSVRYVEPAWECMSRWVAGLLVSEPQPEGEVSGDEVLVKGSEVYVGSESDGANRQAGYGVPHKIKADMQG